MIPAVGQSAPELARRVVALEAENRRLRARLASHEATSASNDGTPGPFFVGGTGRSGTWLVGRVLRTHPEVSAIRTELRFHSSDDGMGGVLDGRESVDDYIDRVRDRWFNLIGPRGEAKGLFLIATPAQLAEAERELRRLAPSDLPAALRSYMEMLIDPFALGRGCRTWVETTPDNSAAAHRLTTVFPHCRVIDIVRDGRDSAASVVTMPWGPNDPFRALAWWADRVRSAHDALSASPPERVHRMRFEELSLTHRNERLHELMSFCGLEVDQRIQRSFDKHVDAERAHVGRWRREIRARDRRRFDDAYRRLYDDMRADGVMNLPIEPDAADLLAD